MSQKIKNLFDEIVALVQDTPVTPELEVSNEDKLRMYGLYKHVRVGVCGGSAATVPSVWKVIQRAKYEAWFSYRNLTPTEAMLRYVQVAAKQPHWLGRKCCDLFEAYEKDNSDDREEADNEAKKRNDKERSISEMQGDSCKDRGVATLSETKSTTVVPPKAPHLLERFFGVKAVIPRGQLDISYRHLATAARYSLESSSSPKREACEEEIASLWKKQQQPSSEEKHEVLVGFSARSLLDLYLRSKAFPPGSEVIVVPPINIPAVVSILEYHQLSIVSIDLPESFVKDQILRIDVNTLTKAVTSRTAAIMVVHPFGIETATERDMQQLRALADKHGLDIIEDCAECYSGACSTIRRYSDLALFSFGTIKTATALGGGVALLGHSGLDVVEKMKRLHQSLYEPQTQSEFLWKVAKAFFIKLISDFPIFYGVLVAVCQWLGLDFDRLVSSSTRSFPPNRLQGCDLIHMIRRRPSLALLSTLAMKLRDAKRTESTVKDKIQRCERMMAMLGDCSADPRWPHAAEKHAWWLAPILVPSPEETSRRLLRHGFDVPRGLSQLQCIGTESHPCPRAQSLMDSIVYLPISSRMMSQPDVLSLTQAISTATTESATMGPMTGARRSCGYSAITMGIALVSLWTTQTTFQAMYLLIWVLKIGVALILAKLLFDCLLTYFMAGVYLDSSGCFAKYNPMLRQIFESDRKGDHDNPALDSIQALRLIPLPVSESKSKQKPSILLTGATGFLGSSILRGLLTSDEMMSSIDRVVLICRAKRGKSASQRITDLLDQEFFSFLSQADREKRIVILEGDVSQPNAGLTVNDVTCLCSDLTIQSVINCAASVGFTQSLDEAAASNITSALHLQRLSQRLNAKFVHISTAFVHGGLTGSKSSPLSEELFSLDKFDANKAYKSMTGNQMYASRAMSALGFPNTYTFSKCICEHLLLQLSTDDDVIVIRPAIIGPALQEPFEGWAGQKPSTIVAATCLYMKFPWTIWCFGKDKAAVIPVDVVARFILSKALKGDNLSSQLGTESRPECSSPASSEFEKVPSILEVESLSSDNCSDDAESSAPAEGFRSGIYNAAWNSNSPELSSFSYFDFATSIPHLGTVLGCFSRCTAYGGFAVSVRILPSLQLTTKSFALLYRLLVQLPFVALVRLLELAGQSELHRKLSKLLSFLDLPVLFYPFVNNTFVFESELKAPETLDGNRYMFSCIAAAHRFLYELRPLFSTGKGSKHLRDTSHVLVGGKYHHLVNSDLWWTLTQPCGNMFVRLVGYLFLKLLRASCTAVSVDVESFAEISRHALSADGRRVHIVLAPTHRSFYDFILVSFIAFSIPELKVKIPNIAAADEFANLPLFGWCMGYLHAFFVKRGRGIDPKLAGRLQVLKANSKDRGACIEVFVEGSRSRDRRFLKPKNGFLRCLQQTGGDHLIVPICINYEKIPEQGGLSREGASGKRKGLRTTGLLPWIWETLNGRLPIGSIHVAAGKPIALEKDSNPDFGRLAAEIQYRQQSLICVSNYHLQAAAYVLRLDKELIADALGQLGCKFWPKGSGSNELRAQLTSSSEAWSITMQFGHVIAPKLKESHVFWADWLCPLKTSKELAQPDSDAALKLISAFEDLFDRAMGLVDEATEELRSIDICQLSVDHVVQIARNHQSSHVIPDTVLLAYASIKIDEDAKPTKRLTIAPEPHNLNVGNENEELGMWGFKDSRFQVQPDARGNASVVMGGNRYGISGKPLTRLIPFIEAETQINIDLYQDPPLEVVGIDVEECSLSIDEVEMIKSIVSRTSITDTTRVRHGTGHSQADAYQLRCAGTIRVPDLVVWPSTETEVENLIKEAQESSWNLIPHGGGTNVSQATKCPSKETDPRPIISVDMTDMKRVLWVNEEDGLAHVQAGITGSELVEEMKHLGYTIGHEPDSLEFSTLGGWIATKASGMKRSKYGNIEDIVVDIRVAASAGSFWQGNGEGDPAAVGRQSRGPDLLSLFLGSEGCLGIITSAVTRIWPLPPVQDYESVLLRDFNTGVQFAHHVSKLGPFVPASVRLLDNAHFRLGQAMREEMSLFEKAAKSAYTLLSPSLQSMSSTGMVCATILFEGIQEEVNEQRRQIKKLATKYGGILLGPRIGRSGYDLTFVIAYLRDFALSYNFLGESFETFAPWSKLQILVAATKQRIKDEHKKRRLPGEVFVGCRVTQLYHSGACLYFYLCMYCGNVDNANAVFSDIEHCARQEILDQGGSLSHHHGVGKVRADFLRDMDSKALREGILALKDGLDPSNTFGARNGIFGTST